MSKLHRAFLDNKYILEYASKNNLQNINIVNRLLLIAALTILNLLTTSALANSQTGKTNNPFVIQQEPITTGTIINPNHPMGDAEQQALGCVIAATTTMATAAAVGPSEIIMLWGGGMLFPSRPATVWLSLFAQIGVSSCIIGAIITPAIIWTIEQADNIVAVTVGP
ncbi:hypothetical protein TI05_03145 [Achromatium sp. WMS3]|nr:hypothetical protein TI05_03145 [Achromatium sp. WMS3]